MKKTCALVKEHPAPESFITAERIKCHQGNQKENESVIKCLAQPREYGNASLNNV